MTLASRAENNANPDQLASQRPADLDLHFFRTYNVLGLNMAHVLRLFD